MSLVVSHLVSLLFLFLSLVSVVSLLDSFDGFASLSDCISFHFEISGLGLGSCKLEYKKREIQEK